ncbi:TPA: Sas10/Utp3/C1D family protein [Serratia fonticola]
MTEQSTPPHQQRVHDEFAELNSRLEKLKAFVAGDAFKGIHEQDQDLLEMQVHAMAAYSTVLAKRIERF